MDINLMIDAICEADEILGLPNARETILKGMIGEIEVDQTVLEKIVRTLYNIKNSNDSTSQEIEDITAEFSALIPSRKYKAGLFGILHGS